jgi:hypothetical protein
MVLLAGKASSRQARVMRGIIITMLGGDITTSGEKYMQSNVKYSYNAGKCSCGQKTGGGCHAGRHHHTKIS